MHKIFTISIKAAILNIIVALIFSFLILGAVYEITNSKLDECFKLINTVAIKETKSEDIEDLDIAINNNRLTTYPEYGTKYGTLTIDSIGVNLPVYFGDTLEVLKKGVGHSSYSYFPGESASIVYMAHNSKNMLRRLGEVQKGDLINVTTTYGDFTYEVYDMKLISETDFDSLPIQKDEEILMLYTCYPFNNIGYTKQRYVVYAKKV